MAQVVEAHRKGGLVKRRVVFGTCQTCSAAFIDEGNCMENHPPRGPFEGLLAKHRTETAEQKRRKLLSNYLCISANS